MILIGAGAVPVPGYPRRAPPGRLLPAALLALALLTGHPLGAQEAPADPGAVTAALLQQELAVRLPSPWRLAELRLEAQADLGSAAAPEIHSRLLAMLALALPTFEPAGREGEITFARPVAPEGYRRAVQGLAISTRRDGRWETRITLEPDSALAVPGLPAAALPGRVVMLGSEEEARLRAARAAADEAGHAAALAAQRRAAALATEQGVAEAEAAARRQAAAARVLAEEARAAEARRQEAEEARRLAEARRDAAEALEAAVLREAAAQRMVIEARARQIAELRTRFAGDRNTRLAALDQAMRSGDPAIRALGFEAALASQDAAAIGLALRLTLVQKPELQVVTFAPAVVGPGQGNPQEVVASLSGFAIVLEDINPATGSFTGMARLGGGTARATGALGRSEMTVALRPAGPGQPLLVGGVAQEACSLALRLSEVRTLDGLFGCTAKETPRLIARIALD
ncbi:hypothetical protein [Roseicella aerolata]|uniref:Uncharacterized protein n=1 Tax=Roseicella aerolata TaxID=2883479 RepID=A0A9X1L9W0_9PROT|nr:hypothetical protein [Roseicella aerolata]MCB4821560.1 hypothetical protein [Roseicella aerolata]